MEIDDRYVAATPEGVSLEFVLAGLGSRFVAVFIDLVIQVLAAGIVIAAVDAAIGTSSTTRQYVAAGVDVLIGFLAVFGYFVLFECLNAGRSPGKALTGLRVVRVDGGPVGVRASVLRNVGRLVDLLPSLYAVGAVLILVTRNNQRLGDLLAGTLVIRERGAASRLAAGRPWTDGGQWDPSGWTPPPAPGQPGAGNPGVGSRPWAPPPWLPPELAHWDVTRVGAAELAVVNRFLAARAGYTAEARQHLAVDLAGRLWPLVAGPTAPMDAEHFLEAVRLVKAARG